MIRQRLLNLVAFLSVFCLVQPAWASIRLSNPAPKQGETIEATCDVGGVDKNLDYETAPAVTFNHKTYKLFPTESGGYHCLLAMPADLAPGKYTLTFADEQCPITVKDANFPVQHLTLPKTKDNFIMSPGEQQTMNRAKATLSDKRLWDGCFANPCKARISAVFGIRRIVNGKLLKDYYHSGIDFAGSMGAPVKACADGRVLLAHRNFKLHGNVIALDHGQGVVTIYIHLQKIMVKEGDIVKAGQQIGAVGATGRANGPHLHLSVYVNQVATNPLPWFSHTF
jgi:murein DD-endopeptidase MepM/ murein hydrolase activator NlpD